MTTTILNTKLEQAENKTSDINGLVKKKVYNAKISSNEKNIASN